MRLCTFTHRGVTRAGVVRDAEVVDLGAAARDVGALLAAGPAALAAARRTDGPRLPLADVRLEAPIRRPGKFLGIGLNYASHARETHREPPAFPVFFNKQTTCVNGPYEPIELPRVSEQLDYEGELGVVVGRRCRHVPRERAREVVAGWVVVNDVSVRDWQRKAPTMTLGKSFDTHGPHGPWLTTIEAVPDPHDLALTTWVNGERRQHARTDELIFDVWSMIALLSTVCTLEPGDLITTGTPAGVGAADGRWLRAGDVVRVEIAGLGHLENRVVPEPAPPAW